MPESGLTLGALGSAQTFNGIAAQAMLEHYPGRFESIVYFPTSQQAFSAAVRGEVDATCAPERSSVTGFHAGMLCALTAPRPELFIVAEVARIYHCSLLAKPGAALSDIRRVCGHDGSIAHSRKWLEQHLPGIEIEVVGTNSTAAAQGVSSGDGSIASVGSVGAARELGLSELVRDIDGGSAVNYWAISRRPLLDRLPNLAVVVGRFSGSDEPSRLIGALFQEGYALRTVASKVTGGSLGDLDYVMTFSGAGHLDSIRKCLAEFSRARLAGAFEAQGEPE